MIMKIGDLIMCLSWWIRKSCILFYNYFYYYFYQSDFKDLIAHLNFVIYLSLYAVMIGLII